MKFKTTEAGIKVFYGKKFSYAFTDAKPVNPTLLLEPVYDPFLRVTLKVKNFTVAKKIIQLLEE